MEYGVSIASIIYKYFILNKLGRYPTVGKHIVAATPRLSLVVLAIS